MGKEKPVEKKKELYSHEQLKRIVEGKVEPEEGEIRYFLDSEDPGSVLLMAEAKIQPDIMNAVDRKLWDEEWQKRTKKRGISYRTNHLTFSKDVRGVDYSAVFDFVRDATGLIRAHNTSAQRYNEQIATPYQEERRKLLEGIL